MIYYKIIINFMFLLLFIGCNKSEKVSSYQEIIDEKIPSGTIKMEDSLLINRNWEIRNVKHSINMELYKTSYYETFRNKEVKFENTEAFILDNDIIGTWNNQYIIIDKIDSLKGKYYFMKMNNLVQLIRTESEPKKEYYFINIQPKKEEDKSVREDKEINFDN